MAEEFQESEVIFVENVRHEDVDEADDNEYDFQIRYNNNIARIKTVKRNSNSVPVNIPDRTCWFKYMDKTPNFFEDEYRDDEDEMLPPHVITDRRIAGKMMTFSVCTGNGRTLKGRDLSQVRNSVLRMTGFLET